MEISEFDRFRLINAIIFAFLSALITPILIDLKGELLSPETISLFMIFATLAVKTNGVLTKMSLSTIYRVGVVFNFSHIIGASLYFYDKTIFLYLVLILSTIEVAIFSAYRIKLNEFQAINYSTQVKSFQIVRNNLVADSVLLALSISAFIAYTSSLDKIVAIYLFFTAIYIVRLLKNWNFFNRFTQSD